MGLQSVKTLVLGFSLVTNLSKNKTKGFNYVVYWKRSIYSAAAARTIASKMQMMQQEEAFLAALLKDIGMLVLDTVLGEEYGQICEGAATHLDLVRLEKEALGVTHAEVGAILAAQWKLPPVLAIPVGHSHNSEAVQDPALRKLCELVELSGWCGDVFVDDDAAPAIAQVRTFCANRFKMSDTNCDALLAEIGQKTKEIAGLFEINIGSSGNYEQILKKANETLIELTLQTQQQNQQLKRQAATDGLTGLANRAQFDAFFEDCFARSMQSGQPLTLLLMDIDKFKSINDRFGHQTGDRVIQGVSAILQAAARPQDLAARYGGEEMAIVLPNTSRATGAAVAESIRRSLAARPLPCDKPEPVPVTISIGVASLERGSPFTKPAQLLKAADLAVYAAKNGGRNCVKVFSPAPTAKPAAA
jgi:diguanylate cyclase (GGDEF)-like protein